MELMTVQHGPRAVASAEEVNEISIACWRKGDWEEKRGWGEGQHDTSEYQIVLTKSALAGLFVSL